MAATEGLLDWIPSAGSSAPPDLVEEARARRAEGEVTTAARLVTYFRTESEEVGLDYLSRETLRPYAAVLSALELSPDRHRSVGRCTFCGAKPFVSSRKEVPGTHGAQRYLVCSLCGRDWPFNRVTCPACFEDDPERLPTFQVDRHPGARVEACETCGTYVKSIDLSLDARREPEVDEIASVALDLWAVEQGYHRVEPGLAGI